MAEYRPHPVFLTQLDASDPEFPDKMLLWTFQARCDIRETVFATKRTITASKTLMIEADRILAVR